MWSFLKHAAVYGAAAALVKAAGVLLVPMYTRVLGPDDYGVQAVIQRLAETASTLLLIGGFRQALFAQYNLAEEDQEKRRVVCAAYALLVAFCVVGGALLLLAAPWLAWLLSGDRPIDPFVLRLGILAVLLEPFHQLPLCLLQARMRSVSYLLVVLGQFLARVGLAVLLVAVLGWGVAGVMWSLVIAGAAFGVGLTAWELSRGLATPTWGHVWAVLGFALPLLPGGLCFFVLHHGDRFFLLRASTAAEVGVYDVGYRLAMLVGLFGFSPLYMVWSARMYEAARQEGAPEAFGAMFTRLMAVVCYAGLGLCLFAPEGAQLLGGPAYAGAVAFVPLVVLACCLQSAATLFDAGLYIRNRAGLKLAVTAAATAVMLALYAWLIPLYHGIGAALATLGGFAFLAGLTYAASQRVFPVRYEWGRLAGLVALTAALWGVGQLQPWGLAGKVGLSLAAPLVMMAALASAEEKALLWGLLGRIGPAAGGPPLLPAESLKADG